MGEKIKQVYFIKDTQMTTNIWKDVQDNSPGECKLKPGVTNI